MCRYKYQRWDDEGIAGRLEWRVFGHAYEIS